MFSTSIFPSILYCLLAFTPSLASAQNDTLRALFLGNSYTAANSLPWLTQQFATDAGKVLIVDSNTPGGYTLEGHSTNPTSLAKIRQGNWDFVVLQEQSQIPTIDYYRYNSMYPGAIRLNDSIKAHNPCAKVTFFMTWGRRYGGQQCDQNNLHCSPVFVDFSHMQDSLESAYTEIADSVHAWLSPVGVAWKNVIEDTSIVLHSGDNSHPNTHGSYLAACVFHALFWDQSPVGNGFMGSLPPSLAAYLQAVADSTVFHSSANWSPNFSYTAGFSTQVFGDSVAFTNLSNHPNSATYTWDFGDGDSSMAMHPSHVYDSSGTYTVTLIVQHCGTSDTVQQTVTVTVVGMDNGWWKDLQVYPNPFGEHLYIKMRETGSYKIEVMDVSGKLVLSHAFERREAAQIHLKSAAPGIYFLKITDTERGRVAVRRLSKR